MSENIVKAPNVPPFVTFVTSAVPMVFDNSLSYYEALCALWKWLQDDVVNVINNNATVTEDYINLTNELKTYVENYFDNLDVQEEINTKLDAMVSDGTFQTILDQYIQPQLDDMQDDINSNTNAITTLTGTVTGVSNSLNSEVDMRIAVDTNLQSQITGLASGAPLAASSVAGMTDTTKIYVNTSDGKWYYYDGDSWEVGGDYQSSVIPLDATLTDADKSAQAKAVGDIVFDTTNGIIEKQNVVIVAKEEGKYINGTGGISNYAGVTAYSEPIEVHKGDKIVANLVANTAMAAIAYSDAEASVRTAAVMGRSYANEDYTLISDRDGYIILSYYLANTRSCTINIHRFSNALDVIDDVQEEVQPVDAITIEVGEAGKYINASGSIVTYANFSYTKPIPVNKGDYIEVTLAANTAASVITYVTNDMTFRRSAVMGDSFDFKTYTLTSQHTGYIVLCYNNANECSCKITRNKVTSIEDTNVLKDKFIVWCGDSIMRGNTFNDSNDGWAGRVNDLSNCRMKNYGVGGSTITNNVSGGATPTIYSQIETAHTAYPDADYIIFDGGCNDADLIGNITSGNIPEKFGSFTENDYSGNYDTDTFCGAFETICMHLSQYWLGKHVGYIIPHKMGVANYYDSTRNNYRAYYETAIQICKKWGIAVLNLWDGCYLNPKLTYMCDTNNTMTQQQIYDAGFLYADRQHLTSAGYDYESTIVNEWVKSL